MLFLSLLNQAGEKPSGSEVQIISLDVQRTVCLEMNIRDDCCCLKDPWVAGLIQSISQ